MPDSKGDLESRLASTALSAALHDYVVRQLVLMEGHLHRRKRQLHAGIHECRKAARRARSVLALTAAKDEWRYERVDQEIHLITQHLSPLRDAHVVAERASALKMAGEHKAVIQLLREALKARRDELAHTVALGDPGFGRVRERITRARNQFVGQRWRLLSVEDIMLAIRHSMNRVRKAESVARATPTFSQHHRWRRRLRRLRMQLQVLEALARDEDLPRQVRGDANWLLDEAAETGPTIGELSQRSDALGTRRDRAMLRATVRSDIASPLREQVLQILKDLKQKKRK